MYTWEIKDYLEERNYLVEINEFQEILKLSPQVKVRGYNPQKDNFYIITEEENNEQFYFEYQAYNKKLGQSRYKF
jgi:hypothetical protein